MAALEVNAAERARRAVKLRLAELRISKRAFGKQMAHGDAWAGQILSGKTKISLADLDDIARVCRTTSYDLIRREEDEAMVLRPTEARAVRALRALPVSIRDYFVVLTEYLAGVLPNEIELLKKIRRLSDDRKTKIEHWLEVTLLEQEHERGIGVPADPAPKAEPQFAPIQRTRIRR